MSKNYECVIGLGIHSGRSTKSRASDVFERMRQTGQTPRKIISELGLVQVSDEGELFARAERIAAENPGPAHDFRRGKQKAPAFLMDKAMQATNCRANPQSLNRILIKALTKTNAE